MKTVNIIMFILLLLCIAVQYNDPDPIEWMLIYGYAALVTAMAIAGRYTVLALFGLIGYVAGFFYWMPNEMVEHPSNLLLDLRMHEKGVEEVREDVGLLLCAAWMLVLSYHWWRKRSASLVP
ncbi:MAG: hypothetical protein AMXMBFR4_04660 [Candidatus Hydrogenedentota bacterium]